MCTVTYIPPSKNRGFILTSNRDEKQFRPTLLPAVYDYKNVKLAYPKDVKAGGSWIAANANGKICCLLNGGLEAHTKQEWHTVSRGTILLDFTASNLGIHNYFGTIELLNVEPFTIVTIEHDGFNIGKLTEFIWDGKCKSFRNLNIYSSYIWSSVTLYSKTHRKLRQEWFDDFILEYGTEITAEKALDFHMGTHTTDHAVNVIMKREGELKTVSITQISNEKGKIKMHYSDLLKQSNHQFVL